MPSGEDIDIRVRLQGARDAAQDAKKVAGGIDEIGDQAKQTGRETRRASGGVDRFGRSAKRADTHTRKWGRGFVTARKASGRCAPASRA
jgi:hypothetical protein